MSFSSNAQNEPGFAHLEPADPAFVARLERHLPAACLRPADPTYLEEPRGRFVGRAGIVACPRTVDEVATILALANEARVAVVPFAGGTGLVGGQLAPDLPDPLILSFERMNRIRAIDPVGNTMIAEAGCILAEVHEAAQQVGRMFPMSLASEGSARIGGLLATNAGGIGVVRWGTMRALCLGLEAVAADGRIWHGLKALYKDNAGYDLRDLVIGSEGTLMVITAAVLKLVPKPERRASALFVVDSPVQALALLAQARTQAGEALSACELVAGQGLRFVRETFPELRQPFAEPPAWSVLVDIGTGGHQDPAAILEAIFAAGIARDGVIAASEAQRRALWTLRETIPLANRRIGAVSNHDISLPVAEIPAFLARADAAIAALGPFRINAFGHLGDGNLHYNVFPPPGGTRHDYEPFREEIKRTVHDLVHALGGSIAAEHGIGRLKVADLERYGDPTALELMRAVKRAFDPRGILNPGAVLRASYRVEA